MEHLVHERIGTGRFALARVNLDEAALLPRLTRGPFAPEFALA